MISPYLLTSIVLLPSVYCFHADKKPWETDECKVYVIKGDRTLTKTTILGTLNKLGPAFSLSMDIKLTFLSSIEATYKFLTHSKETPWMGSELVATGTNKGYRLKICGPFELTRDGCTQFGDLYSSGKRLHFYSHRYKNKFEHYSRDIYINGEMVENSPWLKGANETNVQVVATVPKPGQPAIVGNMYFGSCGSSLKS